MTTEGSADTFLQAVNQAASNTERLELTLGQLVQSLKKRGLQFSVDFGAQIQAVRNDLSVAQRSGGAGGAARKQNEKLVDTSALLTSSLELDEVLEEVMDTIIGLTGAQRAYLVLREKDSTNLVVRAARNWDGANIQKDEAEFSQGIINTAMTQGKPILTSNAQLDTRFQGMESVAGLTLRSIVCIPLTLRGQCIGVLYADNRMQEGLFQDNVIPMLTAFGNQAAIAIENARLFAQVKSDLEKAQRQVQSLRIQIDQQQADSQIEEIVGSDLFKKLARRDVSANAESSLKPVSASPQSGEETGA
jgi:transcriptional regulator with GAF, ATPase, and Fis domain